MLLKPIPLQVQVDMIFRDLMGELCGLMAGTVFIQFRNRRVSTFGVRHRVENRVEEEEREGSCRKFLLEKQVDLFREAAAELVQRHKEWCRGTVSYRFQMNGSTLSIIAGFEHSMEDGMDE